MFHQTDHADVVLSFEDQVFLLLVGDVDTASGPRLLFLTRDLLDGGAVIVTAPSPAVTRVLGGMSVTGLATSGGRAAVLGA